MLTTPSRVIGGKAAMIMFGRTTMLLALTASSWSARARSSEPSNLHEEVSRSKYAIQRNYPSVIDLIHGDCAVRVTYGQFCACVSLVCGGPGSWVQFIDSPVLDAAIAENGDVYLLIDIIFRSSDNRAAKFYRSRSADEGKGFVLAHVNKDGELQYDDIINPMHHVAGFKYPIPKHLMILSNKLVVHVTDVEGGSGDETEHLRIYDLEPAFRFDKSVDVPVLNHQTDSLILGFMIIPETDQLVAIRLVTLSSPRLSYLRPSHDKRDAVMIAYVLEMDGQLVASRTIGSTEKCPAFYFARSWGDVCLTDGLLIRAKAHTIEVQRRPYAAVERFDY